MSKFKIDDEVRCIEERENFTAILGKIYKVTKLECCGFHTIETGDGWFEDDMFEIELAWQPEPGEMIEVLGLHDRWHPREFVAMVNGGFLVKATQTHQKFFFEHLFIAHKARPLKKTHTITLEDGTKVDLSEESYQSLKDGINN